MLENPITMILSILIFFLEILTSLLVLFSILRPAQGIWPPGEGNSPGRAGMLILFNITGAGIITLGILDWGEGGFPIWIRILGGAAWLAGMALAGKAMICLGSKNTTGDPSGLVISGPYRWTRNPQYLGFMAALVGWGLMTSSILTLASGTAGCFPLILVPWAEEPWLLEKYGTSYTEYLKKTPRFLLLM